MSTHWYVYIAIAVIAILLYGICDKFRIPKSKPLRILVVLIVSSLICWLVYDIAIA